MTQVAGTLRAARAACLAVLLATALAPWPAGAQERVRVRTTAPVPGAADGWLGLSVLEEIGVDPGGRFTAVTITRVATDGPAALAGLRPRDRVVRVNGRPATPALFNQVASSLAPGETMRLTVERPGTGTVEIRLTAASPPEGVVVLLPRDMRARVESSLRRIDSLSVTLERADSVAPLRPATPPFPPARAPVVRPEEMARAAAEAPPLLPWLEGRSWVAGARFTPLNAELATYFRVEGGLLLTETIDATPLPSAGARPGDVVLAVDGRPVRTIDELRSVLARVGVDDVVLTIVRHGERMELRVGR